MPRVNLDTHILIHAFAGELTPNEGETLADADWCVSDIVFWEMAKLRQLGRVEFDLAHPRVVRLFARLRVLPITVEVARISTELDFRSDPADELIAATSVVYGIPLMTRDRKIRRSQMVPLVAA